MTTDIVKITTQARAKILESNSVNRYMQNPTDARAKILGSSSDGERGKITIDDIAKSL
jgi:hypothetical protein